MCPHCGAVESGKWVADHSEYQKVYEDRYEERGVTLYTTRYRCSVCRRTWDEVLTERYRDSIYP